MIKVLWRTDVHLADRTPKRRTGDWSMDVVDKLKWIGRKAKDLSVDLVLDGGDFFDVKSPTRNSHALVRSACEAHKDYPCPVYALVGNHDVKYGNIEYLPEQPLSVLFSASVFRQFGDSEEIFVTDKEGISLRIVGIPYHGTEYDLDRLRNIKKGPEDYLFVACHLLARSGAGGSMFENEDIVGYDLLDSIPDVDCWFFGHWHKDQGITRLSNGGYVVNVGSLTRGALHLDDLDRSPCVVEVSVSVAGLSVIRHDVPIRPASEAFKVEEAIREKDSKERMEQIVEKMKQVATTGWSHLSLKDRVRSVKASNGAKECALAYLEQVDKEDL